MEYRGWEIDRNEWGYYEAIHDDYEEMITGKVIEDVIIEIDEKLDQ